MCATNRPKIFAWVIEPTLAPRFDAEVLMESLFKLTELESRIPLNLNVLVKGRIPKVVGLAEAITEWLGHRREVLVRRSNFRLAQIDHRVEVLGGFLVAYLNLDKVIKIIRSEDEPKPVLIRTFKLSEVQAEAILNMRLRNLRKLEEMEIRQEDKDFAHGAQGAQGADRLGEGTVERIAEEDQEDPRQIRSQDAAGQRRTGFAEAPEHDLAAIEEALVEREPITIVVSEKGWIRALKGTVTDLAGIAFKTDDGIEIRVRGRDHLEGAGVCEQWALLHIDAAKLPGGRGHGEPVRLFIDLEQDGDLVAVFPYQGGRKFLVATNQGQGFVVPEDECLGNTRKGKQVLTSTPPDQARALAPVEGELVAAIGDNRKMVIFPIEQVPEMTRGRGVRLQRFKDGGLSDLKTFKAPRGDLGRQRGADLYVHPQGTRRLARQSRRCGRLAPKGFPRSNKFGATAANGKAADTE